MFTPLMSRFSDFAIDIRQVAKSNRLPEYDIALFRDAAGEEILSFRHRMHAPEIKREIAEMVSSGFVVYEPPKGSGEKA